MKVNSSKGFVRTGVLFFAFVIFTIAVAAVDVQPIGPKGSEVGLASVNQFVFQLVGVRLIWYYITDWLGVAAILSAAAFAMVGVYQMIRRRSIRKVDAPIMVLGVFYALIVALYLFFEVVVINCRPVILGDGLEASYPSSHVMIVVCIMVTAATQFRLLVPEKRKLCAAMSAFSGTVAAVTVIGRLLSGVHWFTDIAGGLLLSAALISLHHAAISRLNPIPDPGEQSS